MESIFGKEKDLIFMQEALAQAKLAYDIDEVPIGAIVVNSEGVIIARAYNSVERDCTQRAHAESLAIETAGKKVGDWRLNGCWLYVTLEPCSMCMGLIRLSRFAGVVYGASSPLFGFNLDNAEDLWIYKRGVVSVVEGVGVDQAAELLKTFFHKKGKRVVDKRNLKKIEADLLKRKLELEQKLTEMSKEQFSDGQVQDPGDQALTATMESLRMSLQDAEVEEYRGIMRALERIKEGEYGICADCGNPISEKRLSSFPGTMRCLACQEKFEEKPSQGLY